MSADTPVPQPDDFDAAVDAYMDGAAQPQGQPAPTPVAEPAQQEASQPATAQPKQQTQEASPEATQEATSAAQEDDADDEALDIAERFARAQKREQRIASEREEARKAAAEAKRQVLSYQGNLTQANERAKRAADEVAEYKRQMAEGDQRFDALWNNAIAQAPEQSDDPRIATKAELRQAYDLQKRERDVEQKEQQAKFVAEQAETQRKAAQETHFATMREVATAELPVLLDQAAQALGLPATLLTPVKEYVNSPAVRALARRLPVFPEGQALTGDPANWQLDQIGSVHELRQHLERQAELGLEHFRKQHEEATVAANAKAAAKTYRQEQPIGAATAQRGKDWADMDEDEAFDAWFAQR